MSGDDAAPPGAADGRQPMVELRWDVMWCQRHLEPFRAEWPKGAATAMVKLLEAALSMQAVIDAAHGETAQIDQALHRFAPLCCFVSHDVLERIYRESGVCP